MSLQPEGEDLRKAVKWISEQQSDDPDMALTELVAAAGLKFDLSPKDQAFLFRLLKKERQCTGE